MPSVLDELEAALDSARERDDIGMRASCDEIEAVLSVCRAAQAYADQYGKGSTGWNMDNLRSALKALESPTDDAPKEMK